MKNLKKQDNKYSSRNNRYKKNYIGNKNEGHGFVNKQRERISYQYKKLKRNEERRQLYLAKQQSSATAAAECQRTDDVEILTKSNPNSLYLQKTEQNFSRKLQNNPKKSNQHVFKKLQEVADEKKQEKQQKREEMLKRQQEREAALKNYKEKRIENYKKLCKKTKNGQPVMKYQIEFLLNKIEKNVKKT